MRLLFLTHRADTPSTRYRIAPFVARLQRDGHDARTREYASSPLALWTAMREARDADAVVLQKRLPPAWITRTLRRRAKRLVYDFDDESPESDGERPLYGSQYFARFTQRLISALTTQTNYGALYQVDMRLRPSGRSGPVAPEEQPGG